MSVDPKLQSVFAHLQDLARNRDLSPLAIGEKDGSPALQTGGQNFAHLADARTLVLRCPAEQKVLLMQASPDIYFESDAYVGKPMVLVHLDQIADEELSMRLEDAHRYKTDAG